MLLCTWIPAYYIYACSYLGARGLLTTEAVAAAGLTGAGFYDLLTIIGICLGALFLFMGILQGVLLVLLDYKKMGAERRRDLLPGAFLFPFFTVIYCITMAIGVFSKPKWRKIERNTGETIAALPAGEERDGPEDR